MNEEKKALAGEQGSIRIADEVVSVIAGLAATEVEGVYGMSGGVVGGIAEVLGRKNLSKGVKVEVGEEEAVIDLYMVIRYGYSIPEVAHQIQEKVKSAVESMTGLKVLKVNVNVQGVNLTSRQAEEEEGEEEEEEGEGEPEVR